MKVVAELNCAFFFSIGVPLSNLYAGGINCLMMTLTGRETKGLQVLTERDLCSTTLLAAQPVMWLHHNVQIEEGDELLSNIVNGESC